MRGGRTLADERFDSAMEIRDALNAVLAGFETKPTLAELTEHRSAELEAYANQVLKAQALYRAQDDWIGPIDFVLDEQDAVVFVERLGAYRKAVLHQAFGRQQ